MVKLKARRKCQSWIDSFVRYTANVESAPLFRKWAAISTLAAVLEQRVWLTTSSPLYPNLYVFLVGHAGIGKSRTISAASRFMRELPEFALGPNSVTMASLVDCLVEAKRSHIQLPEPPHEYNSLTIIADELSAFMPLYEPELIGGLTTFYDVVPYAQHRRGKDIRIKLDNPQLSILSGSTPSNLLKFVPELAWEQGFMSRVIMIYSDQRPIIDIFNTINPDPPEEMIHDLGQIHKLYGEFKWTADYASKIHNWRVGGNRPLPQHPKLVHYCSRRLGHVLKMSMVSAVDRGDVLQLEGRDFDQALDWLIEAEALMPSIFQTGQIGIDAQAMDEIENFINGHDLMPEAKLVRFTSRLVPSHAVLKVIEILEKSGRIRIAKHDYKTGARWFTRRDADH